MQEEIRHLEREVDKLKQERKATKKHITIAELPEDERFSRLSTQSKYLIDTIKMIAYRAETAMSNLLRERMSHPDEARSLFRAIYNAEGDILPDPEAGTLTIRLHQLANHMSSESIRYLCEELIPVFTRTRFNRNSISGHKFAPGLRIGIITNSTRSGGLKYVYINKI